MNRLKSFDNLYKVIIATISTIITALLIDYLFVKTNHKSLATIFSLIIVVIIVLILNNIVENLVNTSPLIRKWILKDEFIEGYWYDISYENDSKKIIHSVIIKISFSKGNYKIHGSTINSSGDRIATFSSKNATFENGIILCEYQSHTKYKDDFLETGIMQLHFENPPNSYSGFYFDFSYTIKNLIAGYRITKEELKDFNYLQTAEDKSKFIKQKSELKTIK